jgi:putative acetyltransferase
MRKNVDTVKKVFKRTKNDAVALVDFFLSFGEFLSGGYNFIIRKARQEDFDSVFGIYFDKESNRYLHYSGPMKRSEFKKIWETMIQRRHSYVYEKNGEVIGYISCDCKTGQCVHVAEITPIVVKRGHKGERVGYRLMRFLLRRLKEDGFKRIELMVNADNVKGIRFFRRLGFEREATIKKNTKRGRRYYDDYLMVKFF